jgi:hypothetical protein
VLSVFYELLRAWAWPPQASNGSATQSGYSG